MLDPTSSISRSHFIDKPFRRWVIAQASDLVLHVRRVQMEAANEGMVVCAVFLNNKYETLDWSEYARNNALASVIGEGSFVGPVETIGETSLFYDESCPSELVRLLCLPAELPPLVEESKE